MVFSVLAVLVLGLMCGSEFNIAAFGHPVLDRQPLPVHISMRAALARLLGRVMPFWMSGSTLLNLLLLFPFAHLSPCAWRLAAISFAFQVAAVVFSILLPVPINNRIARWTLESLPENWEAQESKWDLYHWIRTCFLIAAFVLLVVSLGVYH